MRSVRDSFFGGGAHAGAWEAYHKRFLLPRRPFLARAPLGYSAERAPLGGGGADSVPLSNSRTDGRKKTGKRQMKALNKMNLKNTKNFA